MERKSGAQSAPPLDVGSSSGRQRHHVGLVKAEVELDREKRRALWSRLQRIYAEELPVIPLYFRANPFVLPKWLKGVEPTGHQYPTTLWVEHWRAE